VTQKLKGLLHEKDRVKSSKNLGASPFKRDLSVDNIFSDSLFRYKFRHPSLPEQQSQLTNLGNKHMLPRVENIT
jgi:hypothetical protein